MPRPLNATAASMLGFLHDGPMSGWDLVRAAEDRIGAFWSLSRSQVYRELATMEAAGLIEAGEPGARDRRPYRLTPGGRDAFARWLQEDPGPETIRFPLLLKLSFSHHLPREDIRRFVDEHRAGHAARLREYEDAAAAIPAPAWDTLETAVLDFGLRYERAVLDWFTALEARLNERGSL